MENKVHKRYVAFTTEFHDKVQELGFILDNESGNGLRKVRTFIRGSKKITSRYEYLTLEKRGKVPSKGKSPTKMVDGWVNEYTGLTVSEDILKFFSSRQPKQIQ